jgi:hypothetical protein
MLFPFFKTIILIIELLIKFIRIALAARVRIINGNYNL